MKEIKADRNIGVFDKRPKSLNFFNEFSCDKR